MGGAAALGEFVLGRRKPLSLNLPMDYPAERLRMVAAVEAAMDRLLPRPAEEAGGKRLRPVLVVAAAQLFGARRADPLPAAVAVECVHTYSLVHDDLPCMDNDDLRRGRPTAHRAFDEATALLAGDALLTHAFAILAQSYAHDAGLVAGLVADLADAAGSRRLIGGQMEDLLAERGRRATAADLAYIHLNKTAAMIEVALTLGARCGGAAEAEIGVLRGAGRDLGLAFQISDDVLDATADTQTLGKTAGKDAKAGKLTYVSFHGVDRARQIARQHGEAAAAALRSLPGDPGLLVWLAAGIAGRTH